MDERERSRLVQAALAEHRVLRMERDEARAEAERLRADNARLRAEDSTITVYRRMDAAAAGARAERDIMRAAVEEIAAGTMRPAHLVAQQALDADRARREANLAALSSGTED